MTIPKKPVLKPTPQSFIAEAVKKEPSRHPITLTLKPELIAEIDAKARQLGMSRSTLIRHAVILYLDMSR